jgi:hypothetical protein
MDAAMPTIFGDLSEPPASTVVPHSWWWHTLHDLLDKTDERILKRDAKVVMHALWRLLCDEVRFLTVQAPRSRNRLAHALLEANAALAPVAPARAENGSKRR